MLNASGVTSTTAASPVQILANVGLQMSVGCIVPQAAGETVGAKKIVKAGTPIAVDLKSINTVATAPVVVEADVENGILASVTGNAVLLHDVDVTAGAANGTALIFGFVNENRVEASVKTLLGAVTDLGNVTIVKL